MSTKNFTRNILSGDDLYKLRKNHGLRQKEFAEKIEFTQGYIANVEAGKRKPSKKFINAVKNYLDKLSNEKQESANSGTSPENGDFTYIPAMRGRLAAGGGLEPDNAFEMKIAFRKDWITRHGDPGKMSLIRVQGDSMEPTLQSGDWVLIDHQRNYVDLHGGIYAIAIKDGVMIKRAQINARTKKIKITSDNKEYEPLEFDEGEIIINGKMLWFCREVEG